MPEPTATQLPLELVKIAIGVATPIVVAVLSGCRLDDRDGDAPATTPSARTGKARKPREKPSSVHMQHAIQDCLDSLGKPRSTLTADDWKRVTACWIGKETTLNSPAPLFD